MIQCERGWKTIEDLDYTAGLCIDFKDLKNHPSSVYHYHYMSSYEGAGADGKLQVKFELAKYPVKKDEWDVWAFQSINSAAKAVVDKILYENYVANMLDTTYLTDNNFTSELLQQNLGTKESIELAAASQFLNIELPFLDKIDINKLMSVRMHEADTFTTFRGEMERHLRELRAIKDVDELKIRQENIIHELNTQVNGISKKLDSIKRKGLSDAVLLLGGLAGTVQTAGWSMLSVALAMANGYKSYQDYRSSVTENPSYLLWKVLKK